jgi:hypothetical protein
MVSYQWVIGIVLRRLGDQNDRGSLFVLHRGSSWYTMSGSVDRSS